MSQLVFYMCWNLKEADSNASEGKGCADKERASRVKNKPFLLLLFLYRLPGEGMAQIKGVPPSLKVWIAENKQLSRNAPGLQHQILTAETSHLVD